MKNGASDQEIFNYNFFINNQHLLKTSLYENIFPISEQLAYNIPINIKLNSLLKIDSKNDIVSDILNLKPVKVVDENIDIEDFTNILNKIKEQMPNDKLIFEKCKNYARKLLEKENLNSEQKDIINKIINLESEIPNQGMLLLKSISYSEDFKLTKNWLELYENIMKLSKEYSHVIMDLEDTVQDLGIKELSMLSDFFDLTKFDLRNLFHIDLSKWCRICTGEKEETSNIFKLAKKLLKVGKKINPNITDKDINSIHTIGMNQNKRYGDLLKLENGNLVFNNGKNSFQVAIQKIKIEGRPVILIKDLKRQNEHYIAYNGAITKLENSQLVDNIELQKSLFYFCKYSKKQNEIYTQAAKNFPIKIIDNNSKCIIGKGIAELNIKNTGSFNMDDNLTKYYQKALQILKDNDALTVQNIIRIVPQGSNIQINPYTTSKNGKMLYSISAEWKSSDGIKWQLRTHSTDLEYFMNSGNNAENSDWIFRLGHEVDGEMKFFEFNDMTKSFEDTGDFSGKSSHIQIPQSPFEDDNLLGNIHFQNIIRQISTNINEKESVECLAKELGLNPKGKNIKQRIVEESFNNSLFYLKHKEQIDIFRKDLD